MYIKKHANDSIHLLQVWRRPLPHIIVAFHTILLLILLITIINVPPCCHNIQLWMNSLLVLLDGVSTKVSVFNSGIQSLGNASGNSNHGFVMLHIDQSGCCHSVFTCYHCCLLLSQCHSFLAAFFWGLDGVPELASTLRSQSFASQAAVDDRTQWPFWWRCNHLPPEIMYNPVYFGDNGINCQSTGAEIQPSIVVPNVHLMEGLSSFQLKNWRELQMFQVGWESDCNLDIQLWNLCMLNKTWQFVHFYVYCLVMVVASMFNFLGATFVG